MNVSIQLETLSEGRLRGKSEAIILRADQFLPPYQRIMYTFWI